MMLSRASRVRLYAVARTLVVIGVMLSMMLNSSIPAFAAGGSNGNIHGALIDGTSKAAIVGAKIGIASPSGSFNATTDGNGKFSIDGLPVDTYILTIQAQGYDVYSQAGVTILGDQTVDLGQIAILKLRTIITVRSRSASGAFQPNQTIDAYSIDANRQAEVLGKAVNTNENSLLLSVPGTSTTDMGRVTIRGGLSNEVGYQLDGVPFTEPFFSTNGSAGTLNGLGSLQVVEGAGDATQGNVGSGVVNARTSITSSACSTASRRVVATSPTTSRMSAIAAFRTPATTTRIRRTAATTSARRSRTTTTCSTTSCSVSARTTVSR
jgi:hypothetical protein